jgi:hypothetical protein
MNKIKYDGVLDLNGYKIPCYNLEDGTRVVSGRGIQEALKLVDEIDKGYQVAGTRMQRLLGQKSLKPFIYLNRAENHYDPLVCYKGNSKINGYEATTIVDICEAMLDARSSGISLGPRQEVVANQCEVLIRAFAKVGINALVDEATGYQYDRERDALNQLLKAYVSEELQPWQKKFPDIYYKELFRLNGWDFTVSGIKKRPGVVGKWTNKLVYEQLPKGILKELQEKVPKSERGHKTARLHQLLTNDIGNPHLSAQLNQVITLFQLSDNMKHMWDQFEKLQSRQSGQMELPFDFDNKGRTIEKKYNSNEHPEFDTSLKKALAYDAND